MVGRIAIAIVVVAACVHAEPFRIIDLGTIGGTESQGVALNENGQVAVDSRTTSNAGWQPFLWDNGTRTANALLAAGGLAYVFSINDAGFMVGRQDPGGGAAFAVRWAPDGSVTELPGGAFAQALGINNAGVAVGASGVDPFSQSPVAWDGLIRSSLPTLAGGSAGAAWAINEAGWKSGWSESASVFGEAVIWMPDGTIASAADPSWDFSSLNAINNNQQAVGTAFTATGALAIYWEAGTTTVLPVPVGKVGAAWGINDAGVVVGAIGSGFLFDRAVYWDAGGTMYDLNSPELAAQGWTLTVARGINSDGWIVGIGELDGVTRGFLLQPVPEPGSFALLGGAMAGLWLWRRRRRRAA